MAERIWRELVPSPDRPVVDWGALREAVPVLAELDGCPQDHHHPEGDAGTHTRLVVACLLDDPDWRNFPAPERDELFWAAVLHDIGKPARTRRERDGRISSRGHAHTGASIARRELWRLGVPLVSSERIVGLVERHQLPF